MIKLGNLDVILNTDNIECIDRGLYSLNIYYSQGREHKYNYGTGTLQQAKLVQDFNQLAKILVKEEK